MVKFLTAIFDDDEAVAKQMCAMIDIDGDGTVTEAEFLDWASCVEGCQTENEHEIVAEMFAMIDTDDSGDITISELSDFMMKFGNMEQSTTLRMLEAMFREDSQPPPPP